MAAGAMIFGQFLSDSSYSPMIAAAGMTVWIVAVAFAMVTLKGGNR